MPHQITGHAIVSVDGKIAAPDGTVPAELRNDADWRRFQAQLDASDLVVLGRLGHDRNPNPSRRRLVATRRIDTLMPDPNDVRATLWNPAGISFEQALAKLGYNDAIIAVAGVFDLFRDRFTAFDLVESQRILIPDGLPCFTGGHPHLVLAQAGLHPVHWEMLDEAASVSLTRWEHR